jgi:signal transduction histidine kinase
MFRFFLAAIASFAFLSVAPAAAQQRASGAEAVALVKKAAAYIHKHGLDAALKEFNNGNSEFVDGDLYIVVLDMNGRNLAHGANPRIIGKDLIDFKDADGKAFVKEEIGLAKAAGTGWVDFKFLNPVSRKIERKSQYLERVGDVIVMSGIYKGQ